MIPGNERNQQECGERSAGDSENGQRHPCVGVSRRTGHSNSAEERHDAKAGKGTHDAEHDVQDCENFDVGVQSSLL